MRHFRTQEKESFRVTMRYQIALLLCLTTQLFAQKIGNYSAHTVSNRSVLIEADTGETIRVTPYGDNIVRVQAVREKYAGRRLIAVFEPRSNSSRRNVFQHRYTEAFDGADRVFIPEPPMMEKIPPEDRFSSPRLVRDLQDRGLAASYFPDTAELTAAILKEARCGDVILVMSNGAFDNLIDRLLERL